MQASLLSTGDRVANPGLWMKDEREAAAGALE